MKWLEKNWLIVLLVLLGYLWFNGTLGNMLSLGSSITPAPATNSGVTIMGG